MTLIDLQREAASLQPPDRQKLMVFLVALTLREDRGYQKEIADRLREDQPGACIPLDEAERRLRRVNAAFHVT